MSDNLSELVVHILIKGKTVCGMHGLPKDWPENHRWVSFEDPSDANCEVCVRMWAQFQEHESQLNDRKL